MRRRDFIGTLLASPLAMWLGINTKPEPDPFAGAGKWTRIPTDVKIEYKTPDGWREATYEGYDENGRFVVENVNVPMKIYARIVRINPRRKNGKSSAWIPGCQP